MIRAFIPEVIQERDREKPWRVWEEGTVLFADVSGFTPMSETLAPLGAEGAEILTDILNRFFSKIITPIHAFGGQVMKFGGDALLCYFPGSHSLPAALRCGWEMQKEAQAFHRVKTPVKTFALKMKIGISFGQCLVGAVGSPLARADYFIAGEAVDRATEAEHHAKAGEIIIAYPSNKELWKGLSLEKIDENFYKVWDIPFNPPIEKKAPTLVPVEDLKAFLIPEVFSAVSQGWTKHLNTLLEGVPLFMGFSGFSYSPNGFDLPRFNAFYQLVVQVTRDYNGRINRLSMGDKGSTFFILFGAPNPLEKKEALACQWVLDLAEKLAEAFPFITYHIGLNCGKIFSGVVGGAGRLDYTVMGDAVNLAARLMQKAKKNQAVVSPWIREKVNHIFTFSPLGKHRFKGKKDPLAIHALKARKEREGLPQKVDIFVGRKKEIHAITSLMGKAKQGKPGGVVLVGEPGTGKSFLALKMLEQASQEGWKLLMGRGEITLRNHPYGVWKGICKKLFFPEGISVKKVKQSLKENHIDEIYLPWHLEFFGLPFESPPSLDEETKKTLFHHQLVGLFQKHMGDNPLVLYLDDLHWLDTLSWELLLHLLASLKEHPFFLLATTRPMDRQKELENLPLLTLLTLTSWGKEDVSALASAILKGEPHGAFIDYLFQTTQGNPLFTRYLLEHLKKEEKLDHYLGKWNLKRGTTLPSTLSYHDLIASQVEGLPMEEKILLRAAACMGPTFSYTVLKKILGKKFQEEPFHRLIQKNYLLSVEEDTYTFPHALLQEVIYHAIPQKTRRSTHRRIGKTMEKVFSHQLEEIYPNLANHFHLGDLPKKARLYAYLAGKTLYERYSYPEALSFLERALKRMHSGMPHFWETGELTVEACLRSGELSKAQAWAHKLKKRALRKKEKQRAYLFSLLSFQGKIKIGDFRFVSQAKRLPYRDFPPSLKYPFYLSLGKAYYFLGKYREALSFLEPLLQEAPETEREEALIYVSCIYLHQGNQDSGIHLLKKTYQNKVLEGKSYKALHLGSALAGIYMTTRQWKEGEALLLQLAKQAESLGDYYHLAGILFNLGHLYYHINKAKEAEKISHEALDLFSKIGALNSVAQVYLLLGGLYFKEKKYMLAYEAYKKACEIYQHTEEKIKLIYSWHNLAEVCFVLKNYQEAKQWLHLGLKHLEKVQHQELQQLYDTLAKKIQKATGR